MATRSSGLADALYIEDSGLFISFNNDDVADFDAVEASEFVLSPTPHQPITGAICGLHRIAFDDHRRILCHGEILELRVPSRL